MSGIKTALKAAKAALDADKYQDAIDQAKTVLKKDSSNYHAYDPIFIALLIVTVRLILPPSVTFFWAERSKS